MWQSPEGHRAHTLQDSVYDTGSQTSTYLRPRQAAGANGMGNLTAAKGKRALPPPTLRPQTNHGLSLQTRMGVGWLTYHKCTWEAGAQPNFPEAAEGEANPRGTEGRRGL